MEQIIQTISPIHTLIDITKELTAIIKVEIECLKKFRPSEIVKFQERKNILTASYQKELNDIKINGGLASAGNGEVVRKLKAESRFFQEALKEHHRFIKAKKKLSEQMIQDISMEVSAQNGSHNKYGPNAQMAKKSLAQNTVSLAINKTI